MSIYYQVKEHLVITKKADGAVAEEMNRTIRQRLSELAAVVLVGNADFYKLELNADGFAFAFSGKENMRELHVLLEAMRQAQQLELSAEYWYRTDAADDPGPFWLIDVLEELVGDEPERMDGAFYSVYAESDDSNEPRGLYAFGMKNGQRYAGKVSERKVNLSEVPDDAEWHSVGTATMLTCEAEESDFDRAAAEDICRQLSRMSEHDQLTNTEEEFSFFLNNYCAKNSQDLLDFLRLSRELSMLTGGVGTEEWLVDWSGADARLLRLMDDAWGGGVFYLTSV